LTEKEKPKIRYDYRLKKALRYVREGRVKVEYFGDNLHGTVKGSDDIAYKQTIMERSASCSCKYKSNYGVFEFFCSHLLAVLLQRLLDTLKINDLEGILKDLIKVKYGN